MKKESTEVDMHISSQSDERERNVPKYMSSPNIINKRVFNQSSEDEEEEEIPVRKSMDAFERAPPLSPLEKRPNVRYSCVTEETNRMRRDDKIWQWYKIITIIISLYIIKIIVFALF